MDFSHFCTFTSSKPISIASTRRIAEQVAVFVNARTFEIKDTNAWNVKLSPFPTYAQLPIKDQLPFMATSSMFWAAEKFDVRDGYHFHALISTPLHAIDIFNWYKPRFGRCQIINNHDDDRRHAASYYCSKYITKSLADYDIYFSDEIKSRAQLDLYKVYNHYDRRI